MPQDQRSATWEGFCYPPRMPIFAFIGQPPCYRVSTIVYCHCERSEAISHFRLLRRFAPRNDSYNGIFLRPYPAAWRLSDNYGWSKFDPSECPRINDRQPGRGFATPKNADFCIYRTTSLLQGFFIEIFICL